MTAAIAVRPDLDLTVGEMRANREHLRSNTQSNDVSLSEVLVNTTSDEASIRLGRAEVPVTDTGLLALAEHLQVPAPFFKRIGSNVGLDLQAEILNALLSRSANEAIRVEYGNGGLVEVGPPGRDRIMPGQIIDVAERVFGDQAIVQRLIDTPAEFAFDVHVPFESDHGIGGDTSSLVDVPEEVLRYSWATGLPITEGSKVGDVTAAGARFGLDRKRGLAPTVQPWSMRLACTNGMENTSTGIRMDARGLSVDEVLAELEGMAQQAFAAAEANIAHFYDLRNNPVENPERALRAIARERGIPNRSLVNMLDLVPAGGIMPERPTEFDIVNLVTNLANRASVRNDGGRLLLERAGGGVVADHAARCSHCQTVLAN